VRQRSVRGKRARNTETRPRGFEQHRDEEVERRGRRQLERVGDRRLEPHQGQLQIVAAVAPYVRAIEENRDGPGRHEREGVEWVLVAWPGLLTKAEQMLGTQVGCAGCGRQGTVVRVLSLDDWHEEGEQ
jgi:hypothetical protein